jgi:diketogulonate reductase-like aldo/keto reductase
VSELTPKGGVPIKYQKIKSQETPSLGLGTWRLSGEECAKAVERALTLGYRHVDTARMYRNEDEVGRGIKDSGVDREDVFLVTKVWPSDFSHDDVVRSTHESLRKLGTDYVDLLLMHWPSQCVPLEETLGAMTDLKERGGVRHVGVSNFPRKWSRRLRATRRSSATRSSTIPTSPKTSS